MKHTNVRQPVEDACVSCGELLNATDGPKVHPKAGDISICRRCGHAAQFDADGHRVPLDESALSEEDREEIAVVKAALSMERWQ